jgi:hypothetical protein
MAANMRELPAARATSGNTQSGVMPRRRYLKPRRAGRNYQRGFESLDERQYVRAALLVVVATLEIAAWVAARAAGLVLTALGLVLLALGVAARSAAFAHQLDDEHRLDPDTSVRIWTRWLLLIPWALGLVSAEHAPLASLITSPRPSAATA